MWEKLSGKSLTKFHIQGDEFLASMKDFFANIIEFSHNSLIRNFYTAIGGAPATALQLRGRRPAVRVSPATALPPHGPSATAPPAARASVVITNLATGKRLGSLDKAEVYFHDIPTNLSHLT
uniref:Uncharacterized protein n=1 Tax=Oryza sativa subsp. japonica TaxID=39947 RepID=Q2QUH3_ORYSJ|nr:hypothetical protein LOC_Os12g16260 [Oryza sativa Japonica Group]